jgi:hypothetical protein
VYLGTPELADIEYELGNVFHITAEDLMCHSITVGVGIGTSTPAQIEGRLYRFDIATGAEADLLGTTQPIDLNVSMLNGYGDQVLTNLVFDAPIQLYAGEAYYVAVASADGVDNFVCAMSGVAQEATALVRYFPNDWYYLDMLPMVRMNFGAFNALHEESVAVESLRAYPNPATEEVLIELPAHLKETLTARWYNATGGLIRCESFDAASQLQYRPSVAELAPGIYQVVMTTNAQHFQTTIIRQ